MIDTTRIKLENKSTIFFVYVKHKRDILILYWRLYQPLKYKKRLLIWWKSIIICNKTSPLLNAIIGHFLLNLFTILLNSCWQYHLIISSREFLFVIDLYKSNRMSINSFHKKHLSPEVWKLKVFAQYNHWGSSINDVRTEGGWGWGSINVCLQSYKIKKREDSLGQGSKNHGQKLTPLNFYHFIPISIDPTLPTLT